MAVGDASDGLVGMENATTFAIVGDQRVESPRAYANRSHSGQYGIVNSEEGFQNLTRFLFGSVRVDGFLDVFNVTLLDEVQTAYLKDNDSVRASYRFEIVAATARQPVAIASPLKFSIPVDSPAGARPGVTGQLRIEMRLWQ